jgi:hypothetical protein
MTVMNELEESPEQPILFIDELHHWRTGGTSDSLIVYVQTEKRWPTGRDSMHRCAHGRSTIITLRLAANRFPMGWWTLEETVVCTTLMGQVRTTPVVASRQ